MSLNIAIRSLFFFCCGLIPVRNKTPTMAATMMIITIELFMPAVCKITHAVRSKGIPLIFFPKGLGSGLRHITPDVCDFVSIDWQTSLTEAREMVHPEVGLQGNIDPHLLFAPQKEIARILESYKPFFRKNPRWIVNLGHGVLADTPLENVQFLIDWIKNTNWK